MTAQGFDHDLLMSMDKHLASIDSTLKEILALSRLRKAPPSQGRAPNRDDVTTSDSDLDSQYGDPEVHVTKLRDYAGPSMKGKRYSQCPAAFLDALAGFLDWAADKAEQENATYKGKPEAPYKRKDAARARGWAARIRDGKVAAPAAEPADDFGGAGSF